MASSSKSTVLSAAMQSEADIMVAATTVYLSISYLPGKYFIAIPRYYKLQPGALMLTSFDAFPI